MSKQEVDPGSAAESRPLTDENGQDKPLFASVFDGVTLLSYRALLNTMIGTREAAGYDDAPVMIDEDAPGKKDTDKKKPPLQDKQDQIRTLGTEGPLLPETNYFRGQLLKAGIDPDKMSVRIGLYEPFDRGDRRREHPAMVRDIITDPDTGLSRKADVRMFNPEESTPDVRLDTYLDRPDPIKDFATAYSGAAMADLSNFIKDSVMTDPAMRVLNVSQGFSAFSCHQAMVDEMEKEPEKYMGLVKKLIGEEKAAKWLSDLQEERRERERFERAEISHLVGKRDRQVVRALDRALLTEIDRSLTSNPEFDRAMKEYQETTKKAADAGKFIVVAAGNDGMSEKMHGVDLPEGREYNWYAISDHVISVGGVDTNNTPGDRSDDRIWGPSSPGSDRWHPTVSAQGSRLPSDLGHGEIQGTSFAAPHVSATIGLMLEQNPDLTFDQVKSILERNSTPLPGSPASHQGAGTLNIDKAVIASRP